MDDWDPKVANGFAAERDVILFDNTGVGSSSGETPSTVAAMTKDCVDFCRAIDLKNFDVVGFSLGGMVAQQLAFGRSCRGTSPRWERRREVPQTGAAPSQGNTQKVIPWAGLVGCCSGIDRL
jgi:hypothetical protein